MKPALLFYLLCLTVAGCMPLPASPTATVQPSPSPVATLTATSPATISVCTGVTGGKLNVRTSADAQSPVLGVLAEGEVVELSPTTEPSAGWLAIQTPFPGWVKARYLCGVSQ